MRKFVLIVIGLLQFSLAVNSQVVEDEEVVEVVSSGDDMPNLSTDILKSANPNDSCITVRFEDLMKENCKDCDPIILSRDMDNDGNIERIIMFQKADVCGFEILGARMVGDNPVFFGRTATLEQNAVKECKISVMLHDFDNDGKNEVVVAWLDMGAFINGYVFKWVEPTTELPYSFERAGKFASSAIPYIDGNKIITRAGIIGGIRKEFVYKDGGLRKPKN